MRLTYHPNIPRRMRGGSTSLAPRSLTAASRSWRSRLAFRSWSSTLAVPCTSTWIPLSIPAPVGSYPASVARLSGQHHAAVGVLPDDAGKHRLDRAAGCRVEDLLGARVREQRLEVLDCRKDERQLAGGVAVEGLTWRSPGG